MADKNRNVNYAILFLSLFGMKVKFCQIFNFIPLFALNSQEHIYDGKYM